MSAPFLVFENKLLVGKTIRLKTSADIQHAKNGIAYSDKKIHEKKFGRLWHFVN